MKTIHCLMAACLATGIITAAPKESVSSEGYVYSSFTGDGEDGLHLLTSPDGKNWKAVKNYASIYQQAAGLMRDPSICRGGDGRYHLVWTTGWWNDTIGIAHSDNLIDWSPMQALHIWADYAGPGSEESDGMNWPKDLSKPAPRHPKVRNCWAPEIFYDDQTKPLKTWAAMPVDFWGPMSDPAFTGPGVQPDNTNAEGPSVVRVGDEWFVYCDYWQAQKNGLFSTKDFKTLTRLNDEFKAPIWVRHGTAFKVPKSDHEKLDGLQ